MVPRNDRRNIFKATTCVEGAPHVFEETGFELRPRGCVMLAPSVIM